MQFSYNWLKTRIETELDAQAAARLLTLSGLEVEETAPAAPPFSGVVVAEVKSVEKHPDADRLNIARVDAGTGELIQIVCGAPNVRAGIKVPCALPGAVLPGNFKIKPTKMRGQVSNGMLCSARELGLPEDVDGLLVLPADCKTGENLRDALDLDDTLLTLKITPNRADCLSIRGIAREMCALTGCAAVPLSVPPVKDESGRSFSTDIAAPEDCGRLYTRVIENVDAAAPTPLWLRRRLERSGIRSLNILVDIGNYVMLELGQPMHVFDLDKLSGSLNARRARTGETLECLNGKTVTLAEDTLVIADDDKVLSLAGLMGGAASAVGSETQNILLEAAFFHPQIIAGKARRYGFGSDSSFRFERGVDYALQQTAIERASALITGLCGGRCGSINRAEGRLPETRSVSVRNARVAKITGIDIPAGEIGRILRDLALDPQPTADGFSVTAPSFRFDIEIEEDLIEEIARVYGYGKIPGDSTRGHLRMTALPENRSTRAQLYAAVAALGYSEIVSYAFVDEQWERDFAANGNPIRLQNPIAAHLNVMRSTLIGGLVETLKNNLNRKHSRVRLFETARTFHKNAAGEFIQQERTALLAYGSALPEQWGESARRVDFYDIKGDIETLLGRGVTFQAAAHPALHPGRSAQILDNGAVIGFVGEMHPQWAAKYGLAHAPVLAEIDFQAAAARRKAVYTPVSKFPAVRRDLAFVLPENVTADALTAALLAAGEPLVESVAVFDQYKGSGLPEGSKSLAVKVLLRHAEKTLTDEESEAATVALVRSAQTVGAVLRT